MRSVRPVILVLMLLVLTGGCGKESGWLEIVSADDLDYVAVADGLKTPCKLIAYRQSSGETMLGASIPNLSPVFTPSWRLPFVGLFTPCWPGGMTPGTYTGVFEIIAYDIGPSGWEVKKELPCQVEVVDPSSEPFPGFTKNSGEDITFFWLIVPTITPGLTTQTLEIVNQGGATLTWTLTSDQPWLHVDPYDGDTSTETDIVDVNVNVAGLQADQSYLGALTFDCDSPYISQEKIYVVLTVAP